MIILKQGTTLHRSGRIKNTNFAWFSNENGAKLYKQRSRNLALPVENWKLYTYVLPRNVKLLNLTDPTIVRYIKNQARQEFKRELNQAIKVTPNGKSVIRNSHKGGDRKLVKLLQNLKNHFGYNYNGWVYNKNNMVKNYLIFGKNFGIPLHPRTHQRIQHLILNKNKAKKLNILLPPPPPSPSRSPPPPLPSQPRHSPPKKRNAVLNPRLVSFGGNNTNKSPSNNNKSPSNNNNKPVSFMRRRRNQKSFRPRTSKN